MKRIGVREIANLAGVSPGTVDRALHGRKGITEETRQRILAIAERMGYQPDLAARALSVGRAPVRIGVCIPREIRHYFGPLQEGIEAESRRLERLGVQVQYRPTERLGSDEAARTVELLEAGIDALILTPGDPAALTPVINQAEESGVRVICVDTDAPESRRSSAVCVNAEVCGALAAELLSATLPPESEVAVVTGMMAIEDHRRKSEAFRKGISKDSPVTIVEAHEDEEEAFQKVFALLSERSDIAGLYVGTVNCLPVLRAVCARGLSGKIRVITTDLFDAMAGYFDRGTIFASIHGRPFAQGEIAMRLAVDHIVNGTPLPRSYDLLPHIVMRSNLLLFREMRKTAAPTLAQALDTGEE